MKKLITTSLFTATLLLAAGAASAGGSNLLGGEGGTGRAEGTMYGGASVGQATTNCLLYDAIEGASKDCTSNGWKVYGGYQLTDMFSIEGGYYDLGESEDSMDGSFEQVKNGQTMTIANPSATGSASGIGVSAVATLPVVDNVDVFGKVGVMKWQSEGETTATQNGTPRTIKAEVDGTSLLLGAGASYRIDDNWGVRGEYEYFQRQDILERDQDVSILSAGVTYSTL